ncbi:hypothetical protein ID866_4603 [Astraeus odoratus]|nr:hypothetical protein ID866_4603 [Astraeus odoratus]
MSNQHSNSSESPASEVGSSSTSPAQLATSLTSKTDDADALTSHSHDTPNRVPVDLPRPASTGKGGCWTCRLRRKCLGWGPKRPDWMRDKQAVEAYKADIKAQLTRAGLIRGQPRSSILQATTASSSVFTTQQYQGPPSSAPQIATNTLYHDVNLWWEPAVQMCKQAADKTAGASTSLNSPYDYPLQFDPNFSQLSTHSPFTPTTPIPSSQPSPHDIPQFISNYENPTSSPVTFNPEIAAAALSGPNLQTEHVLYYFDRVCRLQYAFAGTSVENITYSLVLQNPHGPLTNALCALASLHAVCVRAARGLEPNMLDNSQALMFYDNACAQLQHNRQRILSEADASAALHLLSFSAFSGGMTDWQPMLDLANEWVAQTGITSHENPKLALMNMTSAARLALKTTMWLDVMSTVTMRAVPKHLHFYRQLYRGGGGFWAVSGRSGVEDIDMRVESLTGCPDEIFLGIAEISSLECWKVQQIRSGTLSMRELIRRGEIIERHLRAEYSLDADQTHLHPQSAIGGDASSTGLPGSASLVDSTRKLFVNIFREAAIVYLNTVLSGSNPGVPEIILCIDSIILCLRQLPVSFMDRALIFPMYLAGCLADDRAKREVFKSRLLGVQDSFGNILQTVRVLEAVWHRRDNRGGGAVEWRDLLHVQGRNHLLLV